MIKRISVLLLLLALSMTALFGCSQTKETKHASTIINTDKTNKEENLMPVTLNEVAHSIFYAPMYVAIEKGYFEEEGLKIDLVNANGADKVTAALLSGDVQIGLQGPEPTIYLYKNNRTNYLINFAQLTRTDGSFIFGREKIENFTLDDLRGKSILGGRKGGVPEMTLEYVLKQAGLEVGQDDDTKDVNVRTINMSSEDLGNYVYGILGKFC